MFGALRDCVVPMRCARHYELPQTLLDAFDKEITQNFTEVYDSIHLKTTNLLPLRKFIHLSSFLYKAFTKVKLTWISLGNGIG